VELGVLGAGAEGSGLSALLASVDGVERLFIADVDQGRLDLAASRFDQLNSGVELVASVVDAGDSDQVGGWAGGLDAVVNATMPHLNLSAMQGCLQANPTTWTSTRGRLRFPG
jgi:saccharopine dehydrogenase-like NADP-dependent oxidoreductase